MIPVKSQQSWAVVGGGFLGMTLALRLAQQGKPVTLFEAAPALGGVASAWQLGDVVWDRHYHVTLFSDTYLRALLQELGLDQDMQWKEARTGFYVNSQLHSMSSAVEFLQFPPLNLFGKLRLAATILRASRIHSSKTLEHLSVEDWLTKWSGSAVTRKIWLPLLRAKLGDSYRDVSAAFIWATIARMYAARRSGAKTELFGYVPGGYARILKAFEQLLLQKRVRIRLARPVHAIRQLDDGRLRIDFDATRSESFSNVVVTTPAPVAARICPVLSVEEKDQLLGIQHQGIICASLLLKTPLSPFYITNITDSGMPYTAVIEMSALVARDQFAGRALVYLPKYLASESSYFDTCDDEIREEFVSALERMHSHFKRSDVLCFRVSRVKYLLPIPKINYSAHVPKISTSIPGLHLVNSAQIVDGTLNVSQTVCLAESAAKKFAAEAPDNTSSLKSVHHELAPTRS